jgi:hypothetical protein
MQNKNLFNDFCRGQIAFDSQQSARTKHAAHRTADLSTDADRATIRISHQHTFDEFAVLQSKQQAFLSGHERSGDRQLRTVKTKALSQLLAQSDGQIRHLVERRDPPLDQPTPNLARSISRLPDRLQPADELFRC